MSSRLRGFVEDKRGTTFEGIALSVSIIAVAFVASADMLDYLIKPRNELSAQAAVTARRAVPATTAAPDLDRMPTASLPHLVSQSVLDPCTGRVK